MVKLFINNKSPFKEGLKVSCNLSGAEDGTRTHTSLTPPDFESGASANSATSAHKIY